MGKPSDKNAVVDTRGRVYGVENLRVVDASIFPILPAGHPMSTICKPPPFFFRCPCFAHLSTFPPSVVLRSSYLTRDVDALAELVAEDILS